MANAIDEYPPPTPTQAELDAIKRGEVGVTDQPTDADDGDDEKTVKRNAEAGSATAYKTRQAKAD